MDAEFYVGGGINILKPLKSPSSYGVRSYNDNRRFLGGKWSKVRGAVEAKMSDLKRWYSMDRMRYYGLERNRIWMLVCGLAANFKRVTVLGAAT